MNAKSTLLRHLATRLPDTLIDLQPSRATFSVKPDPENQEVNLLTEKLRAVRQESLAASRRGDIRTQARLTRETAEILQQIRVAQGLPAYAELEA